MIILGLETSCDETAAAILKTEEDKLEILSNVVSSQIKLHSAWGGVVPNLAAREHLRNILPVIENSLKEANLKPSDIDLIAVTQGPGLIPALLMGTTTAKTLSYLWQKPLLGVHHIEGHIYANFIGAGDQKEIQFPVLALVVSGGHTQLILMTDHFEYQLIGQTLDDAAGEAFDKVARILGLSYPGGPEVAKRAAMAQNEAYQKLKETLPRPMLKSDNFDFSFSGLKTAVLYLAKRNESSLSDERFINEVCHEFQQAVIDVLVGKTLRAAKKYSPKTIIIAGGVSANQELRKQLGDKIQKELPQISYQIPEFKYSLDNAAMIATAGFYRYQSLDSPERKKLIDNWKTLEANPNLKINLVK